MMTNQVSDLEGSKVVLFRRNANSVPRQRRVDERRGQVLTTKVGLQMPAGLTFEDWERAGRQLSGIVNSSSWWLGDWLVYGKDHYTDRYQRGIRAAGLQYQTLRNYAWVSRRFDFSRRRAALSFQHHAELASLPVDEQELWLDRAEQLQWTTKQLRSAIRMAREDEVRDGTPTPETMRRLAVPGSRLQWWHKAAEQSGIDFEQWVLATLDTAAERALEEEEEQEKAGISA
ncbi:LmbU family transcriptional regulator [Streptomyces sp. AN091965]|uniref:LmbU family transcriptional regulator n=1 Tax=Streptomyces sp. AN091965 TaxID=2927803 RepID=UPI001F617854|nr:LmbU family transcriptional regulator [Streptomyces sp. AN091965]MCI3934211.1 LmbU family transcriptional regulator [Streptomyces sp. AN091965]